MTSTTVSSCLLVRSFWVTPGACSSYLPFNSSLLDFIDRAMLHDEKAYPNPHSFNPERFLTKDGQLDPDVKPPESAAFGFGRRSEFLT